MRRRFTEHSTVKRSPYSYYSPFYRGILCKTYTVFLLLAVLQSTLSVKRQPYSAFVAVLQRTPSVKSIFRISRHFTMDSLCKKSTSSRICRRFTEDTLCKKFTIFFISRRFTEDSLCKTSTRFRICRLFTNNSLCKKFTFMIWIMNSILN